MCGFVGAVWKAGRAPIDRSLFEQTTQQLAHRGPDSSGFFFGEPASPDGSHCWLGHRRLSIIDLETGQQPITNEAGNLQLVCNGEIYNYQSLRQDLLSRGHQFRTASDSEVILHLYEEHGPDCLQQLIGMFSVAIWDQSRSSIFLARDRLGQKPLFYANLSDRLLFASELKGLLPFHNGPRELNPHAIDLYLRYQYVPHTTCIYQDVHQLPPAHYALIDDSEVQVQRYWSAPYRQQVTATPEFKRQTQEELRERLTDAVKIRLRSDVPLGSFLSGGLDSTLITGLMAQELDQPIKTFSIGFGTPEFDESSFAQLAAKSLGTEHHQRTVTPQIEALLPQLAWHYDQPFGDSSAIPTWYLSEETRGSVTVALTGDGGDEVFGGYDRYRAMLLATWADRFPSPLKKILSAKLWQRMPGSIQYRSTARRLKRFLSEMNSSPVDQYFRWISIFRDEQLAGLYSTEFQHQLPSEDPSDFLTDNMQDASDRDLVSQIMASDLQTYLPGDILTKVDLASMAHGLECRSPFLDHRVVELAAQLPREWKLNRKSGKKFLKETFCDLIPNEICERPKMGFGVPLDHWFRNELRTLAEDILLSDRMENRGMFGKEGVERMLREHQANTHDHAARIWSLLMLELWQRTWIDTPQTLPQPITL
ncbi:Asparagine synthetase [glutamine-hydrolyzing] 1 [Polystyrenella longa]|uniref:asparagine synthase (glutamine-hydrolyzing) n=1 Tax=Polystyrenella longa TaxID=2528007 RepID=A0A518CMW3_9PLAN|nr:asparagine synthase (glutamine-hydrolyzing) [Polystyrenella longa]QDU80559.1 Asparagine synthetase [glutamine-hydrolyzing] 1 [Polystyrenella longa]